MRVRRAFAACMGLLLGGCTSIGYYAHVGRGHLALMSGVRDARAVVVDPSASPQLRERLAQALAARTFATAHLHLPDNRSYTRYVELDRPYATWSVFAAPEFSLDPLLHCLPFAGCVPYLGWFEQARAERFAGQLRAAGNDVAVVGVTAYSTIGWFADPILSSMLRGDADALDGVIFHELAHQQLYVPGDAAFNEAWATFVQEQGQREWRRARGLAEAPGVAAEPSAAFTRLVADLRGRLAALYARRDLPVADMRARKQREIDAFRLAYARERDANWPDDHSRDRWVEGPIDNARLVPFALYEGWQRAFARLYAGSGADWRAFHRCARALAGLPTPERAKLLDALESGAAATPPAGCDG